MTKRMLSVFLLIIFLLTAASTYAGEELIWSNFNNEAVESQPEYYSSLPLEKGQSPVLITRVRTYHWNDGKGAAPGEICVYFDDTMEELKCWQAVGLSENGNQNVIWEAATDFVMIPGKSYAFLVSDFESWSYNSASDECGMIELYGENPAPESSELPVLEAQDRIERQTDPENSNLSQKITSYKVPANPAVGQIFKFGHYEQNNIQNDGVEPIEWQVLDVQNDRALLVSRNALDFRAMNDHFTEMTWESSGMRQWLNHEFYDHAFTDDEKNQIITVRNSNPDNPQFGTYGGDITEDRVFLLSYEEIIKNLHDENMSCGVTEFAKAQSQLIASKQIYDRAGMINRSFASWWLRTPGMAPGYFMTAGASVNQTGEGPFSLEYHSSDISYNDVRPSLWVKVTTESIVLPGTRIIPIRKPIPCFYVIYDSNECLIRVPFDVICYRPGQLVKIQFEKAEPGLIFDGWARYKKDVVDYKESDHSFRMPWGNVILTAICKPETLVTAPKPLSVPKDTCYTITYVGNGCLSAVPTDNRCYKPGDTVTVRFDSVAYMPGMIFNGWNMSGSGYAEYGYYYNTFKMPARNVTLTAICNNQYTYQYSEPQVPQYQVEPYEPYNRYEYNRDDYYNNDWVYDDQYHDGYEGQWQDNYNDFYIIGW